MTWLTEHAEHVAAIVGGVYVVVRTIVYLTPTPSDDAFLERVHPLLRGVAKVFGLDLKQGVDDVPAESAPTAE